MRRLAALSLCVGILATGCAKRAPGAAQDAAAPVARIGEQVVTDADLNAEAKGALAAARARYEEEVHRLKAEALSALVDKRLLEAEAKKRRLSVEELLAREVTSKVSEPPDSYLQTIYGQTKASGRPVPPFDQARSEIAAFVRGQQATQVRQAYLVRLRAGAGVETMLPPFLPPRVELKAEGPTRGAPDAPVTIVEFSDYECSFCARAEPVVKRLLDAYPGKVKVVFQNFPLSIHAFAPKASEAALCAGEQGKYWVMHDALFASQGALRVDDLKRRARELGLDSPRFDSCLDSGRAAAVIAAHRKTGEALGIDSTPAFFVNGRPLAGAQPFERFQEIVDHELSVNR